MILEQIKRARNVGTPITALITIDQPHVVETFINGPETMKKEGKDIPHPPIILWDIVKGFRSLNDQAVKWIRKVSELNKKEDIEAWCQNFNNLVSALDFVFSNTKNEIFPWGSTLILYNAHYFLEQESVVQALNNLRDSFKGQKKMIVLMGPDFNFPAALGQDVYVIEEKLPSPEQIEKDITELCKDNNIEISDEDKKKAVDACRGLPPFAAESAMSLSVFKNEQSGKKEIKITELWERKRSMIKQVKGLTMERTGETFDSLGGLDSIKLFAQRLFSGPCRPQIICFLDEIEKSLGGAGTQGVGDSSGTSQDQLGVVLSAMEDNGFSGLIGLGPPGTAKSATARAMAATYGVPLFKTDLGAAKGSLVGQSEQQIRAMMKAILAITGPGGAFFIATCNRLEALPPELRRRFRFGLWFFDLPDEKERLSIGALQSKRYKGVKNDPEFWKQAEGWSGANIRDCCEMAYAMSITIKEASAYIVSAEKQDALGVKRLRDNAQDKYLSASYPGTYKNKEEVGESSGKVISTKNRNLGDI